MLYLHVYGFLKKKLDQTAKLSDKTVIKLDYKSNESFFDLLHRINITTDEIGDCFINGKVIMDGNQLVPDESRIGLFGLGMLLHEGGQYLKYDSIYEAKN